MRIVIPGKDNTEAELTKSQFDHVENIIVSMMNREFSATVAHEKIVAKLEEVNDPLVFKDKEVKA